MLRISQFVTSSDAGFSKRVTAAGILRIPTGFRHKAQGCEERATLGSNVQEHSQPATGLRRSRSDAWTQPRWGCGSAPLVTQGSSFLATLGWWPQSLRDRCAPQLAQNCTPSLKTAAQFLFRDVPMHDLLRAFGQTLFGFGQFLRVPRRRLQSVVGPAQLFPQQFHQLEFFAAGHLLNRLNTHAEKVASRVRDGNRSLAQCPAHCCGQPV